jgi:hypothetical protein
MLCFVLGPFCPGVEADGDVVLVLSAVEDILRSWSSVCFSIFQLYQLK